MTFGAEKDVLHEISVGFRGLADDHHDNSIETGDHGSHGDSHSGFGVHIEYTDLYNAIIFLFAIWLSGFLFSRFLKMPCLVGEIVAGIVLGSPLLNFVPNEKAFVLLGEIGLILLVLEAGVEINLTTLKLIGTRGIIIAIIGSILPIGIAIAIAFALGEGVTESIAAGAAFGPTSLGIAMNILRAGKIVNTPVGQLIVSAAVIDDMIALIILSQLSALVGEVDVVSILLPIVSALLFLVVGGYIAIFFLPEIIQNYVLTKIKEENRERVSLFIMFILMLGLMPACKYGKASYLMGVFISGLTFCRSHEVHHVFSGQFKRVLQWLMRIFFAASIGFQVPIKDFADVSVILKGLAFTLALTGKLAVGFLVPNFNRTPRFKGLHLRDCLVTGFSMAAEGEFAFVIAVFGVDKELISKDLYASIVLAVLISTIVPPFLLRMTIAAYNKKSQDIVENAAKMELGRKMNIDSVIEDLSDEVIESHLREGIKNQTTVFLCIQIQCDSKWGLLHKIMDGMKTLSLEIIDHRSWHPRGVDTTLVNEVYVQDKIFHEIGKAKDSLDGRIKEVEGFIFNVINQSNANIKVHRWFPGVLSEITEEIETIDPKIMNTLSVTDKIVNEASSLLEKKRLVQTKATQERTVEELLNDNKHVKDATETLSSKDEMDERKEAGIPLRQRRIRQRMRSSPVVGGDMFDGKSDALIRKGSLSKRSSELDKALTSSFRSGCSAEIVAGGESFEISISSATLSRLRKNTSIHKPTHLHESELKEMNAATNVAFNLGGFVRSNLTRIDESDSKIYDDSGHDTNSSKKSESASVETQNEVLRKYNLTTEV